MLNIVFFMFIFSAFSVYAHVSGQSVEKAVGEYIVDIGFDEVLEAGKASRFDFNLWDKEKIEQIRFDRIWLRVAPKEGITLATYITTPSFGLAGMSYSFPEAGDYEITARFERGEGTLAEISFPVSVSDSEFLEELTGYGITAGAGIILGVIFMFFMRRKLRKV